MATTQQSLDELSAKITRARELLGMTSEAGRMIYTHDDLLILMTYLYYYASVSITPARFADIARAAANKFYHK
jgi:hypothetical protein